jgi:hypothetical protein
MGEQSMEQIEIGDFVRTSGGIIGRVARVVGDEGSRFYRVQMYTRMHYGVTATGWRLWRTAKSPT